MEEVTNLASRFTLHERSGHDLDLFGDGSPVTPMLMPDPDSGVKDCALKRDDGACPPGCAACASFQLEMSNWLRNKE